MIRLIRGFDLGYSRPWSRDPLTYRTLAIIRTLECVCLSSVECQHANIAFALRQTSVEAPALSSLLKNDDLFLSCVSFQVRHCPILHEDVNPNRSSTFINWFMQRLLWMRNTTKRIVFNRRQICFFLIRVISEFAICSYLIAVIALR